MASIELTFFEMSDAQVEISQFGRKMIDYAEKYNNEVPLEILNAITRVGSKLAEKASISQLSEVDLAVAKYAYKKVLCNA